MIAEVEAKRKGKTPSGTWSAEDIIEDWAKMGITGADDAIRGLHALFGGAPRYDEKTSEHSNPLVERANQGVTSVRNEQVDRKVADLACRRICRRTTRACQRIEPMLLGDDSPLANAWEDICVQEHQCERCFNWDDSYGATLRATIKGEVHQLDTSTCLAIWSQTEEGVEWILDHDEPPKAYSCEDIVEYILCQYVIPAAATYSNARIRKYLDRVE